MFCCDDFANWHSESFEITEQYIAVKKKQGRLLWASKKSKQNAFSRLKKINNGGKCNCRCLHYFTVASIIRRHILLCWIISPSNHGNFNAAVLSEHLYLTKWTNMTSFQCYFLPSLPPSKTTATLHFCLYVCVFFKL